MKKTLKRLLIVSLLFVLVVGCSEQGAQEGEKEENGNLTESGYPIVKEPITLKVMGAKAPINGPWENLTLFKEMEKLTNIKLVFDIPPEASWDERKNLAFASEDLPDFFYRGNLTANDITTYGSQGILVPLEDLIDRHAPNIQKMFEDHPDVKAAMTAADGHIYTLYVVDAVHHRSLYGSGRMWLGADLKAELQLEELPSTTDGFYDLLKTLHSKGLKPLSAANYNTLRIPMLAAFGLVMDNNGIEVANDQARFVPIEDNYREYLVYMNRLYAENLLDNEIFSHTTQEFTAKGKNGQLGVFAHGNQQGVLNITLNDVVEKGAPMFSPLTSPVSPNPVWRANSKVNKANAFAITNKNQEPEATIRWIDFFYSAQGAVLGQFGAMLDDEFMNDPSKRFSFDEFLTPEQKANQAEYVGKNVTVYGGPRYLSQGFLDKTVMERHVAYYEDLIANQLVSEYTKEAVPSLSFTEPEQRELNSLLTDITTYMEEMEAKFIAGQESIDSSWDSYVQTMNRMNVDKVVEIYQAAYDRYQTALGK